MWQWINSILTTDSTEWYETLPYVVGFLFAIIELVVQIVRGNNPRFIAPAIGYMMSEGITVCIMPIYGTALVFDRRLASAIAEKNGKVLVVAMFVAFVTILTHILYGWLSTEDSHPKSGKAS